jgi:hypothetical protein
MEPPLQKQTDDGFTLDGFTVKRRAELAGGEGVEGAEAGGEFGGGEAALAVEPAVSPFWVLHSMQLETRLR